MEDGRTDLSQRLSQFGQFANHLMLPDMRVHDLGRRGARVVVLGGPTPIKLGLEVIKTEGVGGASLH